jgi:glycolate oxidase iron-sulfur subunit
MNSSVHHPSAAQCMKCGFCMSTCPVYQVDHVESHVARGRNLLIRLAEEQAVPDQDTYGACLDACLLCGRCQAVCPAGVPSPAINIQAREKRLSARGVSLWQRLLYRGILRHRPLMAQMIRVAALIPGLNHSEGRPLRHMADATALFTGGLHVPSIASKFLSKRVTAPVSPPRGQIAKGRIAFFPGCGFEFFFSQVGEDAARLLALAGFEVVTPGNLTCCGMAVHNAGDSRTARAMARQNIQALESFDHIVTGCATCGTTLKQYGKWFDGEPQMGAKARAVSAKVADFSQFLVQSHFQSMGKSGAPVKITYHEPCHLKWYQGAGEFPRQLLQSMEGVEFVEMDAADACCGLGGSFGIKHRDTSLAIQEKKMQSIQKTGASIVATACPGCMIQLMDGIRRHGMPVEVVHVAQLL